MMTMMVAMVMKDVTVRTSTATAAVGVDPEPSRVGPFFGAEIGKVFARPGSYTVRFVVNGTLPDAEAPQRALIVARVGVCDQSVHRPIEGRSVAECLACRTRAQKGPGSNRSRDAVG